MIRRRETGLITLPEEVGTEHKVVRLRRHARVLTIPVTVAILVAATVTFSSHYLTESWMLITLWSVSGALVIFGVLLPLVAWLSGRITITSRRIIVTNGFIVRSRREIPLSRVTDVTLRRSPIQAAFGSGDIVLSRGDDKGIRVRDLPNAPLVQAALVQLATANVPVPLERQPRDRVEWAEESRHSGHEDLVAV